MSTFFVTCPTADMPPTEVDADSGTLRDITEMSLRMDDVDSRAKE